MVDIGKDDVHSACRHQVDQDCGKHDQTGWGNAVTGSLSLFPVLSTPEKANDGASAEVWTVVDDRSPFLIDCYFYSLSKMDSRAMISCTRAAWNYIVISTTL